MSNFLATFFYVGYMRPAPGTWGSLVALFAGYLLITYTGLYGLSVSIFICVFLGYWATWAHTHGKAEHDPSEIVIDEVAGQWIALLPIALEHLSGVTQALMYLLAFVGFRIFDITKLGLVGWADRQVGPLGVMLDDIIAGMMTAIIVFAVIWSLA